LLTIVFFDAAVAVAAPIRPPRVPDDPPLAGQTFAVSLNADGALVVPGRDPLKPEDVKAFLVGQVARIKRIAATNNEEVEPALDLSADREMGYVRLAEFLDLAKQAGFQKVSLRATGQGQLKPWKR
jgi:biopolymer transport protein ExbD